MAAAELLADRLGLSKSGAVELALRRLAAREGFTREELQQRAQELEEARGKASGRGSGRRRQGKG